MKGELHSKDIIFYVIIFFIVFVLFDIYIQPKINIKTDFINKFFKKITVSQNIAPERLFINTWRITKNSYVDKTLNNQDWIYWRKRYAKQIKTIEDANIAINSMLASLNDPYTKFLKSKLFSKQKMMLESKITGVGILFNKFGDEVVINHVLENSPAISENIQPGDTIMAVNGKKVCELEIEDIINSIETDEKDSVELVLKRGDKVVTKILKKEDIPIKTMDYRIIENNIGVITLSNIMGNSAVENFKRILIETNNTKGLILDLRDNYGGILANAVQMANYMLNGEKILSINSRINTKYQIYAEGEKVFRNKPVVILINNKTASAAEILAGTLKDNINAVLIGEHTYGKNSIQQVFPMQNATGLILTTDKYILPNGNDIYKKGIIPDIIIEQKEFKTFSEDNQMQTAIDIINLLVKNNG